MRLVYDSIQLDYHPGELLRVVSSHFETQGSGNDDYLPPLPPIPQGHYASMWHAIEAYLQLKYSTGRHSTVSAIYAIDAKEKRKRDARARKDTLASVLAEKGITLEQYKRMPRAIRHIMGISSDLMPKRRVAVDRRKRKPKETQEPSVILSRRDAESERRIELSRQADALLQSFRAEISGSGFDVLDYALADT